MKRMAGSFGPLVGWRGVFWLAGGMTAIAAAAHPEKALETLIFVVEGLVSVALIVLPGILVAAWVIASGAGGRVASLFNGHVVKTVLAAAAIGAVAPVCGVTVLPLMVGLLAAGVPLAPVMAFWLSSPVTDPAMLATTAATLGLEFAIGKTLAAFGIGLLGGCATGLVAARPWVLAPLRDNSLVRSLDTGCGCGPATFVPAPWADAERRRLFLKQCGATARLILICLTPAFAAEYLLQMALDPHALAPLVGRDVWWAVPLAVFVGAPAYLDGYAALPLTRGLIEHGMAPGAAMAFLVSGGVVSIWGAMAILPVLRAKAFSLYLGLALTGSLLAGWVFGLVV